MNQDLEVHIKENLTSGQHSPNHTNRLNVVTGVSLGESADRQITSGDATPKQANARREASPLLGAQEKQSIVSEVREKVNNSSEIVNYNAEETQ